MAAAPARADRVWPKRWPQAAYTARLRVRAPGKLRSSDARPQLHAVRARVVLKGPAITVVEVVPRGLSLQTV